MGADRVVERPAQRVHQPLPRRPDRPAPAALLTVHGVPGPSRAENTEHGLLGRHVDVGGEVPAPFVDTGVERPVPGTHDVGPGQRGGNRHLGVRRTRR